MLRGKRYVVAKGTEIVVEKQPEGVFMTVDQFIEQWNVRKQIIDELALRLVINEIFSFNRNTHDEPK